MAAGNGCGPGESRWGWWASRLGPPILLLLLCAGFFWKLVLTDQYTWLEAGDIPNQVLPWLQVQAGEWHRGRVPLWDPYQWGGQSLIGQAQPGVVYPLNWILFLLPLEDGWLRQSAVHWYFVMIHFMAAWFAYLLCRDLERSRMASVAAGCAFALGGWMSVTAWPQMLNSAVWAPLVLMFVLRSLRGVRPVASAAAAGAALGMSLLAGHHQIPTFMLLATGGIWLHQVFRKGRPSWEAARLAAIFLVFTALTGALQILPAYEYGRLAERWVGLVEPKGWNEPVPYSIHSQYSLIPTSLVAILLPGYQRSNADPFTGVAALTLALLAVALAWRERHVKVFAAIAVGGLLFSLGRNNVFHGVLYALVPLVEKARSPSFAVFIFHFGIAVLAAYGIDCMRRAGESPWPRRAALALVAFGAGVFALRAALLAGERAPPDDRFMVVALVALLVAALLHGWRRGVLPPVAAAAMLTGLMLIESGNVSGSGWVNREEKGGQPFLPRLAQHSDIAGYLRGVPWPARMEVSDTDIPYNFGDWYGIDQFGGYVASLPANLLRLPWGYPRSRQIFGVNYTVTREPPGPGQEEVFQSASGLKVHWNRDAFPRVWTVHEARQVSGESEIRAIMGGGPLDLRRTTFLLGPPPPLETCPEADEVRLTRRNSGRVTIEAEMGCRGMVILGDSYFPGWVAWVDGRRAPIHEAYTAVRGVVVEKGRHTIEMRYLPVSVFAGLLLTLAGFGGALALSIRARGKKARASLC